MSIESIYILIELLIKVVQASICFWFFDKVLEDKKKNMFFQKVLILAILTSIISIHSVSERGATTTYYFIILLIYVNYIKVRTKFFNIFWMVQFITNFLFSYVLGFLGGALLLNISFAEFYGAKSNLSLLIHLAILIFEVIIAKIHIKQKVIVENLSDRQVITVSVTFLIIQISLIVLLKNIIGYNIIINVQEYLLVILLFGVNLFFYKILLFLSAEAEEKYLLEMNIKQIEFEEKYINKISKIYTDIRSWKHDYRNNINVICNLAIANKEVELFEYIKELDKEIVPSEAVIFTGIFIIDSILTSKKIYADRKGIKISVKPSTISKNHISDFDFNIILSNLLDNAIEGALKSEEKRIDVIIREKNNNIIIQIKNTFDGNVKKVNGKYVTTKIESINGLGITRVMKAINKYNGDMYINTENNIFENKIIIPRRLNVF